MNKNYAKDLFQLQSELIDTKVDMAVSKAIDRVVEQIIDLKGQMNTQFSEVNKQFSEVNKQFSEVNKQFLEVNKQFSHLETSFSKLEHRVDANDKTLNSITNLLTEVRSKVIAYSFRGGWVILAGVVLLLVGQASQLLHFFVK